MQSNIMLDIPAGVSAAGCLQKQSTATSFGHHPVARKPSSIFHCARAEGSSWIVFHWQCLKQTTEHRKNHRSGSDLALWKGDARSHQPAWLPWLQERLIATWGWLKNINLQKCMDTCTHCQIWQVAWFHLFWAKARLLAPTPIVLIFLGYEWVTGCWRLGFFNNGCHHESHPVPKILWLFWGCLTWMGDEYDASHSFIMFYNIIIDDNKYFIILFSPSYLGRHVNCIDL